MRDWSCCFLCTQVCECLCVHECVVCVCIRCPALPFPWNVCPDKSIWQTICEEAHLLTDVLAAFEVMVSVGKDLRLHNRDNPVLGGRSQFTTHEIRQQHTIYQYRMIWSPVKRILRFEDKIARVESTKSARYQAEKSQNSKAARYHCRLILRHKDLTSKLATYQVSRIFSMKKIQSHQNEPVGRY